MLCEVVTCNCVRNPGGHAESNTCCGRLWPLVAAYVCLGTLMYAATKMAGDAMNVKAYSHLSTSWRWSKSGYV